MRIVVVVIRLRPIGIRYIGIVENVEELRPEFGGVPFGELPGLDDRKIPIPETLVVENISAHCPDASVPGPWSVGIDLGLHSIGVQCSTTGLASLQAG